MSTFWVRRSSTGPTLMPADDLSHQALEKLPFGKDIQIDAKVPRNAEFHRLVFALFGLIAKAFDRDPEEVRHKLLVTIGEFHEIHFKDGHIDRVPNSLSFAAMDETRFREMFEKLVKATYTIYELLPGDVKREVDTMLAPKTERTR